MVLFNGVHVLLYVQINIFYMWEIFKYISLCSALNFERVGWKLY